MTNHDRRRVLARTETLLRRADQRQMLNLVLVLGLFGAASACSLLNLDYLSNDLVPADAGAANCSDTTAGGKRGSGGSKATAGAQSSLSGQATATAAGG